MKYEMAYMKATETLNRDINLLFQRLNFFLVATAFLLTAFATIVAVGANSSLLNINYIIGVAGFVYSFLIAITNHLNTRIIYSIGEYIQDLETKVFAEEAEMALLPSRKISQIAKNSINKPSGLCLAFSMVGSCFNLVFNLRKIREESVANHTYVVPFFFSIVWLLMLIFLSRWS